MTPSAPEAETSLRERKKARTRRQLIEVSQRLFQSQGFEATTLEQICNEVEVRTPTLLRYFPSKVELALAPTYDSLEEFRQELAARDPDTPVIEVWRHHTLTMSALADSSALPYYSLIWSSPVLISGLSALLEQYEDLLAEELSKEAGVDPDTDLYGRLTAAVLIRGNQSVFRAWIQSGRPNGLLDASMEVIDFARSRMGPRQAEDVLPWKRRRRGSSGGRRAANA